ncbi:MAG: hypothetical protein U9R05_04060, partial [Chloroflexota bacterium]|nr:hypothetical protein [Chloroflexota bacterium]
GPGTGRQPLLQPLMLTTGRDTSGGRMPPLFSTEMLLSNAALAGALTDARQYQIPLCSGTGVQGHH